MNRQLRLGCVLLFLGALLPISAFAVDGVVLINQASVMAAGGFPYKIMQSGSYKLSGNLITTNGDVDVIEITADNVTLDLNGFAITGPCQQSGSSCNAANGDAVFGSGDNITVRNGSVIGMGDDGINLIGSGDLVEEVHAKFNVNDGILVQGAGAVRRCSAIKNGGEGIRVSFAVVEASVASGNVFDGIDAFAATVTGNTSVSNGGHGLSVNRTVYGSNSFQFNNFAGIQTFAPSTSQNNNNCDGQTC